MYWTQYGIKFNLSYYYHISANDAAMDAYEYCWKMGICQNIDEVQNHSLITYCPINVPCCFIQLAIGFRSFCHTPLQAIKLTDCLKSTQFFICKKCARNNLLTFYSWAMGVHKIYTYCKTKWMRN